MTLGTFASIRQLKCNVKIEIVLLHLIKRISHGSWLDLIFIQLAKGRGKKTHNSLDKNHIQLQPSYISFEICFIVLLIDKYVP